jgi:NADP-dependent 3-hydroxy acid dehydrogenase YdfG
MSASLQGRSIIVTGASSGIGQATALALAELGAHVTIAARREDRLQALAGEIAAVGPEPLPVPCDVTDRTQVERVVSFAVERFDKVDAVVANAGVMPLSPMAKLDVAHWDQMIDVNCKGLLYTIGAALPHFLERGGGHIVSVSSVAGRIVFPGAAVYCGTKHFVHAVSEGLRAELGAQNIRVTTVAPGYVATELQSHIPDEDIRRAIDEMYGDMPVLQSEDIAASIVYALSQPPHVSVNEVLVRPTRQPR